MSNYKDLPKSLPPRELPFSFKCTGFVTKEKYEGDFVVNVPTVRDMSNIGIELARINRGVSFESLDRATATLNNAIAYLRVTLSKAPKWFTDDMDYGFDTLDSNVAIGIFNQASDLVDDWHGKIQGKKASK